MEARDAGVLALEMMQPENSLPSVKSPAPLNANLILSFSAIPKYKTVAMEETVASDCSLAGTCILETGKVGLLFHLKLRLSKLSTAPLASTCDH